MSVTLQILKEFSRRTEYKVLKGWYQVTDTDFDGLQKGICIVPGIVLSRMSSEQLAALMKWSQEWGNQLMLMAPWWQVDLAVYLDLPTEVKIEEKKSEYLGINAAHVLISKVPPLWQSKKGDTLAISLHYHSGSGVLTLTTLPLLDYKLAAKRDLCQSLLDEILNRVITASAEEPLLESISSQELTEEHLMVLLLAASGININDELATKVSHYVTVDIGGKEAALRNDLWQAGFIDAAGTATDEGIKMLMKRGYRSFVRELRKQGDMNVW